jgi:tetratricopeptide (TPR) repeat protein
MLNLKQWIFHDILNEFDKALEAYEKAIEIKPDFDEAYYSMGLAYVKSGKFEKATTSTNTLAMSNSSRVVVATLRALFIF